MAKNKSVYKLLVFVFSWMFYDALAMDTLTVLINHHSFFLEMPKTQNAYSRGLMYRTHLKKNQGMIFVFDSKKIDPPQMWMKNTYLSLDMLFIGPDYRIKCIIEHTKPLSLTRLSCKNSILAVIELNAGEVTQFQLKTGMKISTAHEALVQ